MKDLKAAPRLQVQWTPDKAAESLQAVYEHAIGMTEETIDWYVHAKNTKRIFARWVRMLAIVLGAAAALLPTVGELIAGNGRSAIGAGWTTICLAIAAALLLFDRFFGFSTGWMRYISAELQLRQMQQEFQLDWETERASWEGQPPNAEQVSQLMARCKTFVTQVNNVLREETNAWIKEFESAVRQIDESVKSTPAVAEPGALNLTVTNGDACPGGWQLSVDGATPERYRGRTAGKRNLSPGRHGIRVEGEIDGKKVSAERVVAVPVGGTCEVALTLA